MRDLVQQTFLQLHRSRRDYRPEAPLRPWLFTIAYNLCRDRWRVLGKRREVALEEAVQPVDLTTPADGLEARQRAVRLRAALARLPDNRGTTLRTSAIRSAAPWSGIICCGPVSGPMAGS